MNKATQTIDPSKLLKVSNYAKSKGYSRGRIYQKAKGGGLKIVEIDGVKFVWVE